MDLQGSSEKREGAPAWIWVLCSAVLCLLAGGIALVVRRQTGGHWSYPLDDTYIHMALARNLAFYHNWGINHEEFGAASSSPLYTLLLALLFKIFGIHLAIPLAVNLVAAIVLVRVLQNALNGEGIRPQAQVWVLLAVTLFTPLPILVVSGMEHTLQCLFSFLFLYQFCNWTARKGAEQTSLPWQILLWAFLMTAIRYECLFLVAIAGLVLLGKRRIVPAFILGLVAFTPVIIFGLYSMHRGSYFLPNSILLKSGTGEGLKAFISGIFVDKLTLSKQGITGLATQRLLLILPLAYLAFRKALEPFAQYRHFIIICAGATLLHLSLASTGWFYRYEAYLVLNATMIVGIFVAKFGRSAWSQATGLVRLATVFAGFFLAFPLVLRSSAAFTKAPRASLNIFEQQYQMGLFLRRYEDHSPVAANDIGAISFLSDIHTLDLWGLGNIDVARSKRGHYWTPGFLDSLSRSHNVRLALVYDSWFDPALLSRWTKVGAWTIPDNVICGDETVSFYALDPAFSDSLRQQLKAWAPMLPKEVKTAYYP